MKPIELWRGDCFELARRIPRGSVDIVFADLPYGVTQNKWDKVISMQLFWEALIPCVSESGTFIFTATQPFANCLMNSSPIPFRHELIWDKGVSGSFGVAKVRPLPSHEGIYIFGRRRIKYNPQMTLRSCAVRATPGRCKGSASATSMSREYFLGKTYTHAYPKSIQYFSSRDKERGLHPTQKPVLLLEWILKTYSDTGDLVLDPTAGSMTTAVAAYNTGRRAICIEKDAGYYKAGIERVKAAMLAPRQEALL